MVGRHACGCGQRRLDPRWTLLLRLFNIGAHPCGDVPLAPRRTAMKRSRFLLAALSVSAVTAAGVLLAAVPASAANLLTNPGFEAGSLSGWSCGGGTGSVVPSPVHSGSFALSG